MAQEFLLRLITQRAAGGDPIVRERRVAEPIARIGRAPDNDIVLTDLSIDPQHARLAFSGPGRVSLESVAGAPFQVNGRSTQRADFDVASHPQAQFGAYTLAFEPAEDGGAVVTVTQAEHGHHASPSVFSLQSRVLGRRGMAWLFAIGILLVGLLVPLGASEWLGHLKIHPDQQWSSGPLSKAHAFLGSNCKACHVNAFVAVRDSACLACHKQGRDTAADRRTFARAREMGSPFQPILAADHGRFDFLRDGAPPPRTPTAQVVRLFARAFNHPSDRCATCHLEHEPAQGQGPAAERPVTVAFQTCQSCHTGLQARLAEAGKRIDFGDAPSWPQHPQFRPLIMQRTASGFATTRVAFRPGLHENSGLTFSHQLHLDPTGGVTRQALSIARYRGPLTCRSCHEPSGGGFKPIRMERACEACHSLDYAKVGGVVLTLPHGSEAAALAAFDRRAPGAAGPVADRERPDQIAPTAFGAPSPSATAAYRAAISPGGLCYGCHTVGFPVNGRSAERVKLTGRYLPNGDFDHAIPAHNEFNAGRQPAAKCADCHAARTSAQASDVLIPGKQSCLKCHTAKPQVAKALVGPTTCESCHSFHTPGRATPSPKQLPPLEALRWTAVALRKAPV